MKIMKALEKDIDEMCTIGRTVKYFKTSKGETIFWTKKQISNWLNSKDDVLIVAKNEGKIVGFILAIFHKPTGKAVIENLWVDKIQRKNGLGTRLLDTCVKELHTKGSIYINALVNMNNKPIRDFLTKNGFDKGYAFYWMART
jgi:ribosomal protein S18 acetylase RimI-like enzyme